MVIFSGAIIALVRGGAAARSERRREILRRRLADGSISVEAHGQRRATLDDTASGSTPSARPA